MRIGLAQVNATVGDLDGNADKIVEWTKRAAEQGAAPKEPEAASKPSRPAAASKPDATPAPAAAKPQQDDPAPQEGGGAEVVRLDRSRKK